MPGIDHEAQNALVGRTVRDHFHTRQHCGQQIVEVVCNTAGKLAHRFHLLRLSQCGFGLFAFQHFALQPRRAFGDKLLKLFAAFRQRLACHHAVVDVRATAEPANDAAISLIPHRQGSAGEPAMPPIVDCIRNSAW